MTKTQLRLAKEQFAFVAAISVDDINPTFNMICDYGFDSLDNIEYIMALEEAFDIEIDDYEAKNWDTFQDSLNYLEKVL